MKPNKGMFFIGIILLSLLYFSRQPFLARVMSPEERLLTAIEHTATSKNCAYHGNISAYSMGEKETGQSPDSHEENDIQFSFNGKRNKSLRNVKISLSDFQEAESIQIVEYFEDNNFRYLITPFKSYEKIIFNKEKLSEINFSILKELTKTLSINVQRNIPLKVNQNTYDEINIITDCYETKIERSKVFELGGGANIESDLSRLIKDKEIKEISIRFYIDEGLYIRKLEGTCHLRDKEVSLEVYLDQFERTQSIEVPDKSDAVMIDSSMSNWLSEILIQKK